MTITRQLNNDLQISTEGKVYHKEFGEIIPKLNKEGYQYIYFDKKQHLIHRLMAIHFIPNPDNKPIVNHIDGNRQNNTIKNLEWATHKENSNKTILQSSSYKEFKKLYMIFGDRVLNEILKSLQK